MTGMTISSRIRAILSPYSSRRPSASRPSPASRTRYSEDRIPLSVARLISLSSTTKTVFCAAISLPLAPTRTRPWAYARGFSVYSVHMMFTFYHGGGGLYNLFRRNMTEQANIPSDEPFLSQLCKRLDRDWRKRKPRPSPLERDGALRAAASGYASGRPRRFGAMDTHGLPAKLSSAPPPRSIPLPGPPWPRPHTVSRSPG